MGLTCNVKAPFQATFTFILSSPVHIAEQSQYSILVIDSTTLRLSSFRGLYKRQDNIHACLRTSSFFCSSAVGMLKSLTLDSSANTGNGIIVEATTAPIKARRPAVACRPVVLLVLVLEDIENATACSERTRAAPTNRIKRENMAMS